MRVNSTRNVGARQGPEKAEREEDMTYFNGNRKLTGIRPVLALAALGFAAAAVMTVRARLHHRDLLD